MKIKKIETEKAASQGVNRLPRKYRNRFEASLVLPGDPATPAKEEQHDADWIASFFMYGLN